MYTDIRRKRRKLLRPGGINFTVRQNVSLNVCGCPGLGWRQVQQFSNLAAVTVGLAGAVNQVGQPIGWDIVQLTEFFLIQVQFCQTFLDGPAKGSNGAFAVQIAHLVSTIQPL